MCVNTPTKSGHSKMTYLIFFQLNEHVFFEKLTYQQNCILII